MIRVNKKTVSRIITVSVIVLFSLYFFFNIEDFKPLLHINPIFLLLLVGVNLAVSVTNGLFLKSILSLFHKMITIHEGVRISLISSAGNFFAPAGSGLGFRAVYLKKRHSLAYGDYVSIVFCNYVLVFVLNAALGLVALYALHAQNSPGSKLLLSVFLGLFLVSFAMLFIRVKKDRTNRYKNKFIRKSYAVLLQVTKGWHLILSNKRVTVYLFVLTIINTSLMIADTYFIMRAINVTLSIEGLILFSVLGSLSVFINITPGNLGIKEAVYIAFSSIIGLTTAQILSAALVDRAVLFFVLFFLWVVYGKSFYRQLNINRTTNNKRVFP